LEVAYLESAVDAVLLLVKDEGAILQLPRGEKADIPATRELLWCTACGLMIRWTAADGAHVVEMVGDEGLVSDEKHEGEVFEDRYLRYSGGVDSLLYVCQYTFDASSVLTFLPCSSLEDSQSR